MNQSTPHTFHRGWYGRGYHPHCDIPGLIQSIGFRLFDSVPDEVIEKWRVDLANLSDHEMREELIKRIDHYADQGCGCCLLADDKVATLVENAILFFDNSRYDVLAWCILSNHVHVLIAIKAGFPLGQVLQSWKSYTSHEANKLLNRSGQLWFPDYFDRFMRSTQHMEDTIQYIEFNPVTAGMVDLPNKWPFSSAADKHAARVKRNRAIHPEIDEMNLPDF